ncbi:TPA: hypothetical protein QCX06_002148 [Bacillus paranthracis]|nr:hypothetical protein [Bacillus paranthracis]HDR7304545.1 hypothetical protein [Bacillus paranthracis]
MIKDYTEMYIETEDSSITVGGSYAQCMEALRKHLDKSDCIFHNVTFNIDGWEI